MATTYEDRCDYGNRKTYIMILLGPSVTYMSSVIMPNVAIVNGATGYLIGFIFVYLLIGIPVVYMELIVGQFTARDCLAVWKARPCLTHMGYVLIVWQFIHLAHNHACTTFVLHYLLITFENPIPYYKCGSWATANCDLSEVNYTVNQQCIKTNEPKMYCNKVYLTYPEYQYWRNYILGADDGIGFFIAWRVCLASGLICIVLFVSCFRRIQSMKWFIGFFTIYPIIASIVLMLGSMTQKGVVLQYQEVFDTDFKIFSQEYSLPKMIHYVLSSLGVGTGLLINFSSRTSFRAACYANTVIVIIITTTFTVFATIATAMMACPYAHEYGMHTNTITNRDLLVIYEKIPRLLSEYDNKYFYLLLVFSSQTVLGIGTDVVLLFSLTEMLMNRYEKIAKYPGLVSLFGSVLIFLLSIPVLSSFGVNNLMKAYRRFVQLIVKLVVIIEFCVFVVWYGLDKFSEDVHFMQGMQPSNYIKIGWILSILIITYVLCVEISQYVNKFHTWTETLGICILSALTVFIFVIFIVRLLIAVIKKRFLLIFRLDPNWIPRNEVLQRSRAMFSAHAMTKEYLYRQYHLQAGIVARQKASNVRNSKDQADKNFTHF